MTWKTATAILVLPAGALTATLVTTLATASPAAASASRSEVICIQTTVLNVQPPEVCLPDPLPVA
jgi:hypothetical protein